ncbi:methyltransferase, TIGR04325 family [Pedobacter sp. BS3]|uniref:methyltransferase, TIGR04325 family n=1 Tax=Pedobacter sp. BS3 TaxID=2567937 RepID=UPI001F5B0843|nr:methyltransferase, TIGR04325 family [Pedobacter sp. BS3]
MIRSLFRKKNKVDTGKKYGWFGHYPSWEQAYRETSGYDAAIILEKTRYALLQVKSGNAVYERDSVLFDKKQYPFPLITFLLHSALKENRPLHILDFGGSLGSTYYQVKEFLGPNVCASWNVVEQAHYVTCGKEYFQDAVLRFFSSVEECLSEIEIDFVLLSSSVQYLKDPHEFLQKLVSFGFKYLLFDRTAFVNEPADRLTIQHIPPEIYEASYPSWFFNEKRFLSHFHRKYVIGGEFSSYVPGESVMRIDGRSVGYSKGFYLINKHYA